MSNSEYCVDKLQSDPEIQMDMDNMSKDEIDVIADYIICTYGEIKSACSKTLDQCKYEL